MTYGRIVVVASSVEVDAPIVVVVIMTASVVAMCEASIGILFVFNSFSRIKFNVGLIVAFDGAGIVVGCDGLEALWRISLYSSLLL